MNHVRTQDRTQKETALCTLIWDFQSLNWENKHDLINFCVVICYCSLSKLAPGIIQRTACGPTRKLPTQSSLNPARHSPQRVKDVYEMRLCSRWKESGKEKVGSTEKASATLCTMPMSRLIGRFIAMSHVLSSFHDGTCPISGLRSPKGCAGLWHSVRLHENQVTRKPDCRSP